MVHELLLREVVETDLPVFFEHQRDPEAVRLAGVLMRDRQAFEAMWTRLRGDPTVHALAILADGELAGNVLAFTRRDKREVGYWLGRDFWGRGIATAALEAFLRLVSERPLHAFVAPGNAASIRVLQKCGFLVVGLDPAFSPMPGCCGEAVVLRLG